GTKMRQAKADGAPGLTLAEVLPIGGTVEVTYEEINGRHCARRITLRLAEERARSGQARRLAEERARSGQALRLAEERARSGQALRLAEERARSGQALRLAEERARSG